MAAATTTTTFRRAHFLTIPLELRKHIYGDVFPDQKEVFWVPSMQSGDLPHNCILNVILCNTQIFHEVRDFLHCRPILFSSNPSDPGNGDVLSNIPCLHGVDCSRVPFIRFELNPFQYITSIPTLWSSLLSICQCVRKVSGIQHLQIECDGMLPRIKPPLYINEVDLDRGPLNIVLLLQPFNLLHNIGHAEIAILGGPLNDLWTENIPLRDFAVLLIKRLEAPDAIHAQHVMNIQHLHREMQQSPPSLWFPGSCQSTFADLVSDSAITVHPNVSNSHVPHRETFSFHPNIPISNRRREGQEIK
jgi:hypothetical protein